MTHGQLFIRRLHARMEGRLFLLDTIQRRSVCTAFKRRFMIQSQIDRCIRQTALDGRRVDLLDQRYAQFVFGGGGFVGFAETFDELRVG